MNTDKPALKAENKSQLATTNTQAKSGTLVRSTADIMQLATMLNGGDRNQAQLALTLQKILYGLDIGIGIGAAIAGIYIVSGKPTIGAGIMAGAIKGSDKYDFTIVECTKEKCKLCFHENGKEVGAIETIIDDFPQLNTRDNWKNYPDDMLFARAISKGMRRYCPDVFGMTVYVEGELDDQQPREPINITAAATMDPVEPEIDIEAIRQDLTESCEARNEQVVANILTIVKTSNPSEHAKLRNYAKREWKKHEPKPGPSKESVADAVQNGRQDLINEWRKGATESDDTEFLAKFNGWVAQAEADFAAELASEDSS